jgi:hypothetical protein
MPVLCAMAFSDRCEEHCVPGGCGRSHGRACLKNMSECGEPPVFFTRPVLLRC